MQYGRFIFVFLIVFASLLCMSGGRALAQVQAYSYYGLPFDPSIIDPTFCSASGNSCPNGSTVGTIVLSVPAGYSGSVGVSGILGYNFSASGIGNVETGSYFPSSPNFAISNGQITNWDFDAYSSNPASPPYTHIGLFYTGCGLGCGGDSASRSDGSGSIISLGQAAPPNKGGHWSNGSQLGSPCAHYPGSCSTGEPIDLGSGNMFYEAKDYATSGQNPLTFTRYYNSMAAPNTFAVSLGANWRHGYDRYLHIINPSAVYGVAAERADGQIITFTSSSGTYTTDSDLDYTLTRSGGTWTLTDKDDTVETYAASGDKATLQSIKLRNGYTQALSYSSGAIAYVSDSYGRQLGFAYSSAGLLTNVTTPDSLVLSYGYVNFASTGQNRLTTVSYGQ